MVMRVNCLPGTFCKWYTNILRSIFVSARFLRHMWPAICGIGPLRLPSGLPSFVLTLATPGGHQSVNKAHRPHLLYRASEPVSLVALCVQPAMPALGISAFM